jgi:RNA ligase
LKIELVRDGVEKLQQFTKTLVKAGVDTREKFKAWKHANESAMAGLFRYEQKKGMPPVTALVGASFHPELPLLMYNYTPVAHNTLHAFPAGWTSVLRLCRGIVFDCTGSLIAKPYEKFFNYGEHPETTDLPDAPFMATVKHDGHLGICFHYAGRWHVTTRGVFCWKTAKIGEAMLYESDKRTGWMHATSQDLNLLVEIIHPETRVHVSYRKPRLILTGACYRDSLKELSDASLRCLGSSVGLEVAERWNGDSIADLRKLMADMSVRNKEGFVANFPGLRVKFKFRSYIGMMVQEKLTYGYLMNRILSDNLDDMISTLPKPKYDQAKRMVAEIMKAAKIADAKKRKEYLYALPPKNQSTPYFRGVCRKVLKHLDSVG